MNEGKIQSFIDTRFDIEMKIPILSSILYLVGLQLVLGEGVGVYTRVRVWNKEPQSSSMFYFW